MDKTTERIVSYATSFGEAELTSTVKTAALDHLFDSIAAAIAGSDSEPGQIAAKLAQRTQSEPGATVFGYGLKTSPELAAFANGAMIRTYDYNDGMAAKGGGHPSDMLSGILALGEIAHSSGTEVLLAMTLAYEILGGMGYDVALADKGIDQGTFMGPAVALAGGRLLGLNEDQLANAASLALVPNIPLAASRWGTLSMMKGCTTAFSVRNAVFSTILAKEGFTGAPEPYEGIFGMFQAITGPFEPKLPVSEDGTRVVQMSHMKPMPAETNALGILGMVPRIRAWAGIDDIERIEVDLPERLAMHLGDEPKYDPKVRETADHSLPYMLSVALVDGQITLNSYTPERIADPALRPVMRKIVVRGSKEFTKARNDGNIGVSRPTPAHIKITARDGRVFEETSMAHKGHMTDPMSREEINAKFDTICNGVVAGERKERIREAWWNVTSASDIGEPIKTLVGFRSLN